MNTKPMGRLKFAYCKGGAVSWIACAALLVAVVLIGLSLKTALYGSILEMPFMSVVDTVTDGAVSELEQEIDSGKDVEKEARAILKDLKRESGSLSKSEKKLLNKAEDVVNGMGELLDTPSLMVARDVITAVSEDEELIEMLELAEDAQSARQLQEEAENIVQVLDIVVIVVLACFGLSMLLTFLAAMLRSTVLAVFGMLGAAALCALFGGMIFCVAVVVLDITAMILHGVLKKKYTKYKYPGFAG